MTLVAPPWEADVRPTARTARGEVAVTIVTALKVAQALGMYLAALFSELERG